ncbi:MAG: hypothetical protein ABIN97_09470 [Ginsengibacter sp.]
MANYARPKIDKIYIAVFAIAVFFSWILHEFAHWTAGEYLGYKMGITLNSSYPISGHYTSDLHYQIISAAGPALTLCEATLFYALMRHKNRVVLYPFLFTCFYMRLFATIISFRNPNDEARISSAIGIGKLTLPLIMTTILFTLIYETTRDYNFDLKFNLASLGLTILFSSIIILVDMYLNVRLL